MPTHLELPWQVPTEPSSYPKPIHSAATPFPRGGGKSLSLDALLNELGVGIPTCTALVRRTDRPQHPPASEPRRGMLTRMPLMRHRRGPPRGCPTPSWAH